MKLFLCEIVLLFIAACSSNNLTTATSQNETVAKIIDEKTARTLDCNKPN